MKKTIKIFATILLAFTTTVFAQNSAEKVLNDLQNKFDTIKDLTVEFTHSGSGRLAGTLFIKKENKLRIVTENIIIITDGTTSWSYNKKEDKVIISNYDENDPGVFSINEIVYNLPAESNVELSNDNGQNVLTLIPNSYTYSFDSAKLWISENNLISKIVLSDEAIGNAEIQFSNYQLNQDLEDSEFSFTPPEGSRIIDIR